MKQLAFMNEYILMLNPLTCAEKLLLWIGEKANFLVYIAINAEILFGK